MKPTHNKLTPDHWQAIRTCWEYDPDEPTYLDAALRAAKEHGFAPPGKSTIDARQKREAWERRGNLNGINAAAQLMADSQVDTAGKVRQDDSAMVVVKRSEAINVRAQVTVRHRAEWDDVDLVKAEALAIRDTDHDGSMAKLKSAKLLAEVITLKQTGERRAWGLDTPDPQDPTAVGKTVIVLNREKMVEITR